LLAQRNQKHIQTGEYLLPVCPEYFHLPNGVRKYEYTYKTAFFARYFVLVLKFLAITEEYRLMVSKNRAPGKTFESSGAEVTGG
jgi:hypothetical protein